MIAEPTPAPAAPPTIARGPAVLGLVLGVASALLSVFWVVGIPLGILAVVVSWRAAQQARGRDLRTISFAVGGLVVSTAGVLLGLAGAVFDDDAPDAPAPVVINGVLTATPDADHQPPLDLDPGARCTVDLDGHRAEGSNTNRSEKPRGYIVKVVWEDSGVTLAEGTTVLPTVAPGVTAPFASTSAEKTGTSATTCRVSEIDRTDP
jgi:hypothetical protein